MVAALVLIMWTIVHIEFIGIAFGIVQLIQHVVPWVATIKVVLHIANMKRTYFVDNVHVVMQIEHIARLQSIYHRHYRTHNHCIIPCA